MKSKKDNLEIIAEWDGWEDSFGGGEFKKYNPDMPKRTPQETKKDIALKKKIQELQKQCLENPFVYNDLSNESEEVKIAVRESVVQGWVNLLNDEKTLLPSSKKGVFNDLCPVELKKSVIEKIDVDRLWSAAFNDNYINKLS